MSSKNSIIETLINELNKVNFDGISQFNGIECTVDASSNPDLIQSINAVFNQTEELPGNKISFLLTNSKWLDVLFYYNETDFINRCKLDLDKYRNNSVFFLNPMGNSNTKTSDDTQRFILNFLT